MYNDRAIDRMNQVINVAVGLGTLFLVVKIIGGNDAFARIKMRGYLMVSHTAKRQADVWQTLAASADTAYHRCRNLTV